MGDRDTFVKIFGPDGFSGRFGGDGFDGLPVDRDLPPADAFVFAVFLLPDGQSPLLQEVDRVIDVATHVVD